MEMTPRQRQGQIGDPDALPGAVTDVGKERGMAGAAQLIAGAVKLKIGEF